MIKRPFVTREKFGEISCLDGYEFGVNTACNSCDFKMNSCLRRNLSDALNTNEMLTSTQIGYDLVPTYHADELLWRGEARLQLSRHGVAEINVIEQQEKIEDSPFSISPFILLNIAVNTVDADRIVVLDKNYVDNPGRIILRRLDNNGVIEQVYQNGYPRRNDDGDWLIAMAPTTINFVNVQHCQYMVLDVDTPVCEDGTIFAAVPETGEYIPFVSRKAPYVHDTTTTYFFYAWSLVDPAFQEDDVIDLFAGEFYKLLTEVDLWCSTSIEKLPDVMRQRDWCEDEFPIAEDENLVITQMDDNIIDIHSKSGACGCENDPIRIKIYYRTDPTLLDGINLNNLANGIVYLTAAQLNGAACNCAMPEFGFIAQAQKSYDSIHINAMTAEEVIVRKWGYRYGELVYGEALRKTKLKRNLVKL